jgi:hypothetical protein
MVLADAGLRWNLGFFTKNVKYNNNLWEKCLSVSSKVHVDERTILQVRYLTYGWLFYKVHLPPPEKLKQFVKKLFVFLSKEKVTKKPIVSFDRVYQRTYKALGVSFTSVHRIMNGKRPCKSNRPKERTKMLDNFDHCVIKRTIQIITPIIDIRHLVVQNSSIITHLYISISKINES